MKELKIKVNSIDEQIVAVELFKEIGLPFGFICDAVYPRFVVTHKGKITGADIEYDKGCEITMPQLRDMVVLKRNDVNDATHESPVGAKAYISSDNIVYGYVDEWLMISNRLDLVDLKPIPTEDFSKPEELPFVDDEPPHTKVDRSELFDKIRSGQTIVDFSTCDNNKVAFNPSVEHPQHYTSHPSGIECIDITRHHDFAIGNAIKYLWRAGLKDSDNEIQDLEKAIWYIQDKISQLKLVH